MAHLTVSVALQWVWNAEGINERNISYGMFLSTINGTLRDGAWKAYSMIKCKATNDNAMNSIYKYGLTQLLSTNSYAELIEIN